MSIVWHEQYTFARLVLACLQGFVQLELEPRPVETMYITKCTSIAQGNGAWLEVLSLAVILTFGMRSLDWPTTARGILLRYQTKESMDAHKSIGNWTGACAN